MDDERLPRFEPNDITQILLILLRIEAKLDGLLEEDMAKKKMSPEVRAKLEDVRRDVRELIALFQAKLNERRT